MPSDFSPLADGVILEILTALNVLQCRKVCKRLYQASKDCIVRLNLYVRTYCPQPPHDDATIRSTDNPEGMLTRPEIIDAQ
ncbi:hypothetical protein AN958_03695 [Leucoagaricus sp. SymC.cos]|nr:hypothetical protein AN958_03695 [Leucoagaricus sp. SymC.cos]